MPNSRQLTLIKRTQKLTDFHYACPTGYLHSRSAHYRSTVLLRHVNKFSSAGWWEVADPPYNWHMSVFKLICAFTFIVRLTHSIIQNLEVKIYVVQKFKRQNIKKLKITLTCFGSYVIHHKRVQSCAWLKLLLVIQRYFVVCLVGVWQRNFEPVVCVCTVFLSNPLSSMYLIIFSTSWWLVWLN